MRRQSEALLLLPLLPIFLVGMFPLLLIGLLGFAGLGIFGILLVCAGLSSGMEAHNDFIEEVNAHGSRGAERATHASDLHSAMRFAALVDVAGVALIAAAAFGFFYVG